MLCRPIRLNFHQKSGSDAYKRYAYNGPIRNRMCFEELADNDIVICERGL